MSQHIWSPNWDRITGSVSATWVRLQRLQFGVPVYNTRMQTDTIINLWPNRKPGFILKLVVLSCKIWNVAKLRAWFARPTPRAQQSQDSSPLLSKVCKSCTHSRDSLSHSQSGQCPGWLEERSEACSALSLKSKQDYLFNFPNNTSIHLSVSVVFVSISWLW